MKNLLTLILFLFLSTGCTLNNSIAHASGIPNKSAITILDERSLVYPSKKDISFSEISNLSYDKKHFCKTEDTGQIGINISNYEGLAKVGKNNRYLMVSDNNNKAILSTKLIYFKGNK
jgi:hypothetical protein